jgi:hypothetical protein
LAKKSLNLPKIGTLENVFAKTVKMPNGAVICFCDFAKKGFLWWAMKNE